VIRAHRIGRFGRELPEPVTVTDAYLAAIFDELQALTAVLVPVVEKPADERQEAATEPPAPTDLPGSAPASAWTETEPIPPKPVEQPEPEKPDEDVPPVVVPARRPRQAPHKRPPSRKPSSTRAKKRT